MSESSLIKFAKIMVITLVTNSHGKKKKEKNSVHLTGLYLFFL